MPDTVIVPMRGLNDSGQVGYAVLTRFGVSRNQTLIAISIRPSFIGVFQPAHIHDGSCPPTAAGTPTAGTPAAGTAIAGTATGTAVAGTATGTGTAVAGTPTGTIPAGTATGTAGTATPGTGTATRTAVSGTPSASAAGDIVYSLSDVIDGTSLTVLDLPIEDVLDNGTIINVHLSREDFETHVACGDFSEIQLVGSVTPVPGAPTLPTPIGTPGAGTSTPATASPVPTTGTPSTGTPTSTAVTGTGTPATGTGTPATGTGTPATGTGTPATGTGTPATGTGTPATGTGTPATGTGTPAASGTGTPAAGGTTTVVATIASFQLPQVVASVGDTVVWTNSDAADHTVRSGTPAAPTTVFDSNGLSTGQVYSHTFTAAGTFSYFCEIHPSMTGTVTINQ